MNQDDVPAHRKRPQEQISASVYPPEGSASTGVPLKQLARGVPSAATREMASFEPPLMGPSSSLTPRMQPQKPMATPPPIPPQWSAANSQKPSARHDAGGPAVAPDPASDTADVPRFLSGTRGEPPDQSSWRLFGLGFVAATALALIATVALRATSPPSVVFEAQSARVTTPQSTLATLSAILTVPDVSPHGVNAAPADLATSLKNADQEIAAPQSDKQEAKYWLRRSLAVGLGERRLVWAMTKLGTLYATPTDGGVPDYEAARTLWELAGAQGDPVALCFLASLHEHGLGVAKDEARALTLYRSAKSNGGCRDLDQTIARLAEGTQ